MPARKGGHLFLFNDFSFNDREFAISGYFNNELPTVVIVVGGDARILAADLNRLGLVA